MPTVTTARSEWFLERVAETALAPCGGDGRAVLVERRATRAGVMAPLHVASADEAYYVLSGRLRFFVDGEELVAEEGDVVVAPGGVARTLRVEAAPARWLVLTRVRSAGRYEDFGLALGRPARAGWPAPDEAAAVAALAAVNGIRVLGPPGALPDRRL